MSKKKHCIICNSSYEFCGHCNRISSDQLWRNLYCCEDCREIFHICSSYEGKEISADEAYDRLTRRNFANKNIQSSVKGTIEKIMSNIIKTNSSLIEESKAESVVNTEEPVYETIRLTEEDEKPKRKPRRRRMKKIEE